MTRHRIAAGVSPAQSNPERTRELVETLIFEERCRFSSPETMELHPAVLLIATLPDDDFGAFLAATAILLADRLQKGLGKDDLYWHWDAFHGHYGMAPAAVRAAIFQGYAALMEQKLLIHDERPKPHLCLSEKPAEIVAGLRSVLSEASDATLAEIAALGPSTESLLCRAKLREVIDLQDGVLQPEQRTMPGAVLRAAAADAEHPGFLTASACLLTNEVIQADGSSWAPSRWAELADHLIATPDVIGRPILGAIRHLYEQGAWDPFPGQEFCLLGEGAATLPGYADLSDLWE